MLRCTHCDHFNLSDATNCERCGAPLAAVASEQPTPAPGTSGTSGMETQVLEIARTQGKIAAIKHYREATGAGLKEAKDAVESLVARHGVSIARSGCASAVLLLGVACVVLWQLC
jgi:ribosomal protein L7/L12